MMGTLATFVAQVEAYKAEVELYALQSRLRIGAMRIGAHVPAVVKKCHACGSHEFRHHNGARICAYCRCWA